MSSGFSAVPYYNVIKHSGHLGTLEKCRKHSPAARVFYISLVFSNARRVLSQCNTRLRLLYLLNILGKININLPATRINLKTHMFCCLRGHVVHLLVAGGK